MNAIELRINNWVYDTINKKNYQIEMFYGLCNFKPLLIYDDLTISLNECKPILLTEEWLLKFGFGLIDEDWLINIDDEISLVITKDSKILSFINEENEDNWIVIDIAIKHVHQLQNLYFALTGEELIAK